MKEFRKHRKAVALAYKPGADGAPRVTAKGRGKVAEKIIETARAHGVYVHDDPELVESLSSLDLREEIPEELYIVVAELRAFLYSLDGKNPPP